VKDRGKLNAVRSIIAAISDELREKEGNTSSVVDFLTEDLPSILSDAEPIPVLSRDSSKGEIAPDSFEVRDFVQNPDRLEVYGSAQDLVDDLDIETLAAPLQEKEVIGIDESKVDTPLPQSALSLLRTVAFRMFKSDDGTLHEAAGPIVNEMRLSFRDDESFSNTNELIGYIRNNFIAYTSALTSKAHGREPFVVLHGPLIRAIGGFSRIEFNYETAKKILDIDLGKAGEMQSPPSGGSIEGDDHTETNLPLDPSESLDGHENLRQFNRLCSACQQCAIGQRAFSNEARPNHERGEEPTEEDITDRKYPGLCLYFWVLRSLFDLARLGKFNVVSVVENVSRATEVSRFLLPSLLRKSGAVQKIESSSLDPVLDQLGIDFDTQSNLQLYQTAHRTVESLNLTDANMLTHALNEGQYTSPLPVRRYRPHSANHRDLGIRNWGLDDGPDQAHVDILDTILPSPPDSGSIRSGSYRVMMSYLRSTPLREPVRVEYFDLPHHQNPEEVIGPTYLMSIPYQEYGLPLILYYADKLAHTPKRLVRTIVEREYLELTLRDRDDPVSIMRLLGRLSRNYYQREGLQ
jgi:hypothetical protein